MKNILFVLLLVLIFPLFGQSELKNGLLFPVFQMGTITYIDGHTVNAELNYNTLEEEMLFVNVDKSVMAISNPSKIKYITIAGRNFEYVKKDAFYERVDQNSSYSFYIQWKSKLISEGKGVAYGGRSQTSSTATVGSLHNRFGYQSGLELDEKFKTKANFKYYLKIRNKLKRFNSAKSLAKLFNDHKTVIEQYAIDQKIDFGKKEDVKRIVAFCNQVSNNE